MLNGDAADEELLIEENIDSADVFAALTNSEEANILSAMLAKRLGARKVMALINQPSYGELIESRSIDIVISPQTITIGSLLAHVRRGDVVRVHSLRRGAAEAIEAIVHGDERSSRVVGKRVEEIKLPDGAAIGAIVRGEKVIMAHHDTVLAADDHVILFLSDRRHVEAVERLFLGPRALSSTHACCASHTFSGLMLAGVRRWASCCRSSPRWCTAASAPALLRLRGAVLSAAAGIAARVWRRAPTRRDLKPRDGFLLVTLGWLLMAAAATIPLLLVLPRPVLHRAFFETMSGLTTTGATVFKGLDTLPPAINLWRHALHWYGGLGHHRARDRDPAAARRRRHAALPRRLAGAGQGGASAPRIIADRAPLWFVYTLLTIAGLIALRVCGMTWFDAICHAFSAVGLGGFSTHDANIAYFNSASIEFVLIVFMIIASLNFACHFAALRRLTLRALLHASGERRPSSCCSA